MSNLASALLKVAKNASHPNILVHKIQLERVRQKCLVQSQLDSGPQSAIALQAPPREGQAGDGDGAAGADGDSENGWEAAEGEEGLGKESEGESESVGMDREAEAEAGAKDAATKQVKVTGGSGSYKGLGGKEPLDGHDSRVS